MPNLKSCVAVLLVALALAVDKDDQTIVKQHLSENDSSAKEHEAYLRAMGELPPLVKKTHTHSAFKSKTHRVSPNHPTMPPTIALTEAPTTIEALTSAPTVGPTVVPTRAPTQAPSHSPTARPTLPTPSPTAPTTAPTSSPTTHECHINTFRFQVIDSCQKKYKYATSRSVSPYECIHKCEGYLEPKINKCPSFEVQNSLRREIRVNFCWGGEGCIVSSNMVHS
jgi:hypothetical protein